MDKKHVMIRFSLIPADLCEETNITADLLVSIDMTPDDLREALSAAYGKRIGVLKAENPTALLVGSHTLAEFGVCRGTLIFGEEAGKGGGQTNID